MVQFLALYLQGTFNTRDLPGSTSIIRVPPSSIFARIVPFCREIFGSQCRHMLSGSSLETTASTGSILSSPGVQPTQWQVWDIRARNEDRLPRASLDAKSKQTRLSSIASASWQVWQCSHACHGLLINIADAERPYQLYICKVHLSRATMPCL